MKISIFFSLFACSLQAGAVPFLLPQEEAAQDNSNDNNVFEEAILQQQAQKLSLQNKQNTDFEHVLFEYFQKRYEQVLTIIETGDARHQFSALNEQDQDRLRLMQGASLLSVGLRNQGQALLLSLLEKTSSEYVQANTWFWLGKSAFVNKQFALSEQAFNAIETQELEDYLAFEQMQELRYHNIFIDMQGEGDWQPSFERLSTKTIYPAYVLANDASMQFNLAEYEISVARFVEAKQALLSFEQSRDSWFDNARENSRSVLSFDWVNPFSWFANDQNAQSQGTLEAQQEQAHLDEIDALYDTLNLGLSYALLQQQASDEAFEVIKTVSASGGESEQALLTFGWALAQQNRWQSAINVWQYLQQQSRGLYGLQASYALAYAHQQKGEFAKAFFALEDTTKQISDSVDSLRAFSSKVNQAQFFDLLMPDQIEFENNSETQEAKAQKDSTAEPKKVSSVAELAIALGLATDSEEDGESTTDAVALWPADLLELKRFFLSKQSDIDATYLLKIRQESIQVLAKLTQKKKHLETLNQMLDVREQRFVARQQSLSLQQAEAALSEARSQVTIIEQSLSDMQDIDALNVIMSTPDQRRYIERMANASNRLERLLKEQASENNSLRRPVNPKLQERLERVEGIVQWQLDDVFIARQWEHKRLLKFAKRQIGEAQANYERLLARQQNTAVFEEQHANIRRIYEDISAQHARAQTIFEKVDGALRENLLSLIELRIADLSRQQINTRLAKLRLQDLTPEAEQ